MNPGPAMVGGSAQLSKREVIDDFLRELSRIFAALFRQDERGIGLVIAKTRVGCRRDFAGRRQIGRGQGALQFGR